jgi:5-methylcytosine-specific restriction enzyme B
MDKLIEQAGQYILSEEFIKQSEDDRLSFVQKFPLHELKNLYLDEYVQGTDENSFCYWLEFKRTGFGIGGGNASKFGIYKTKKDGKQVYAISSGKNKTFIDSSSANKYYTELMNKVIKALEYTRLDQIDKIKELDIPIWNMVLQKILSIYYPHKFLAIGSPKFLVNCAKEIGLSKIELKTTNSIQVNYECNKKLRNHPPFSTWSYHKLGKFIWDVFDGEGGKMMKSQPAQYWLYAPGENAHLWDEFYQEGIMALGWDEIGDLMQYQSRDEIKKALVDAYGGTGSKKNDVSANDDFLNKIRIGDIIFSKKGRGKLLGYGIVTSDYIYDNSRQNYRKTRKVDWKLKGNWEVDFSLVLKTLTDITKYSSDHPDYDKYYERLLGIMEENNKVDKKVDMNFPLNTIFYGPPGTGKTFNTVLRAAEIVENRKIESYAEALGIFKANLRNQIEFITFHQNYSYEDFIQGLRPDTEESTEELRFKKVDGIFKRIADRAAKNIKNSEKPPEIISNEKRFEDALALFIDDLNENDGIYKITDNCKLYEVEENSFRYSGDNWTRHANGIRMKFADLFEFYKNNVKSRRDIKELTNISGLAKQHATYYFGVFQAILKYISKTEKPIQDKEPKKNYVLIIDEINRANISRVFGELITLIEPDKRSHGTIPMEAKLPSGDTFMVPSNLYIIGTMNTADKSIALLDIALRRRFEFEPMYPKYSKDGLEINDETVLKSINESIISEKGYDFQIGHSYFMDSEEDPYDFKRRMNVKVIPLLLEYFMNDSKTVTQIISRALSNTRFNIDEKAWPLKISDKND